MKKSIRPYGTWRSPIGSDAVLAHRLDLRHSLGRVVGDGPHLYWNEARPAENGRQVLVRLSPGSPPRDILPDGFAARSRVHEYGGGEFLVADGQIFFVSQADQRVCRVNRHGRTSPLTDQDGSRYADGVLDRRRSRLIYVAERTLADGSVQNLLATVDARQGGQADLLSGHDFYSSPRLSPDGAMLAWVTWDHPEMPWTSAFLWKAALDDAGQVGKATLVAGGPKESVCQPRFSPDGILHWISDRHGWWNLYAETEAEPRGLTPMEAEVAAPPWSFGDVTYVFETPDRILFTYSQDGRWHLARVYTPDRRIEPIAIRSTEIAHLCLVDRSLYFRGGAPDQPLSIVAVDLDEGVERTLRGGDVGVAPTYFSCPRAIHFVSGDQTVQAFHYPPCNPDFEAPPDERPPLIVTSHGGPTGAASTALDLKTQFWTSRGFAVVDVNYRGSTGFGRAYRESLNGRWGIADVEDCVRVATTLVERGAVDGERLAIRGSSAGGFTTLCALAFHDVFSAGACFYGVSDLEALARDTHKFESRYLDGLVAPYPAGAAEYARRSPIHAADRLSCPVLFVQGLDDPIVPPDQTRAMTEALRLKGIPFACLLFEGESHGLRRAENIRRALEAELYFYARVFGFEAADSIEPIEIENLERGGR